MPKSKIGLLVFVFELALHAQNPARVNILLPERTRLLVRQRIDLVVEARNVNAAGKWKVTANGQDITDRFATPVKTEFDCNGTAGVVLRADLFEFQRPGEV